MATMSRPAVVTVYRQKTNGTLAILIPNAIQKELGLMAGRRLMVYVDEGKVVLEPLERFSRGSR